MHGPFKREGSNSRSEPQRAISRKQIALVCGHFWPPGLEVQAVAAALNIASLANKPSATTTRILQVRIFAPLSAKLLGNTACSTPDQLRTTLHHRRLQRSFGRGDTFGERLNPHFVAWEPNKVVA